MKDFPFSVYDSFAYLSTGLIVLVAADYSFHLGWLAGRDISTLQLLTILVFAYAIGHVIAYISGVGIEQHFLGARLKRRNSTILDTNDELTQITACDAGIACTATWSAPEPASQTLRLSDLRLLIRKCRYSQQTPSKHGCPAREAAQRLRIQKWRNRLFKFHFAPISRSLRNRIAQAAEHDGVRLASLFSHAWMVARRDPIALERSGRFLNLYGFCRNMVIASLSAGLVVALGSARPFLAGGPADARAAALALSSLPIAYIFVFRYLDFLKRYEAEIYTSYAYSSSESPPPQRQIVNESVPMSPGA